MGVGDHLQAGDAVRLRTYQEETISNTREQLREGRHSVLIVCPTGGGKCLGPDVLVQKSNGMIVQAQALRPGDHLVGDDGSPRTIQSITWGHGPMFRVLPQLMTPDYGGAPFTCNDVHVLTLVNRDTDKVIDIPLDEYLRKDAEFKSAHLLFVVKTEFWPWGTTTREVCRTPFKVEALGDGPYFGFELDGNGRFVLGSGIVTHNTVIGSEIIRGAVLRDTRTLFLAHRRELIDQTSEKLGRFGVPHGVIMGAKRMALQQPVQVASVQTVINRVAVLPRFKLIMVDEAHHVTEGNTYAKLLKAWPEARIIGLTATPWRLDGIGLGDVFDGHILVRTPKQLRDEGYLVPVCGSEYEAPKTSGVAVRGGDFQASDLDAAVRSKTLYGNIVKEWMADAGNVRTIVFCVSVAHAKELAQAFVDAGVRAESVDAKTPKEARAATLARLRSGDTRVVCNVAVLTEGFDCPSVSCVVLARPTLSTSLYLQMVGRALRPVCLNCDEAVQWTVSHCPKCGSANIKRSARIHDHAGCSKAHGHPYSDRDFSPGASLEQVRSMTARQITDSWGNADPKTAGQSPLTPLLVKMVEDVKKTAIGGDGRPMTQAQKTDELKRQREWRAKSWTDKQAIWERLCLKHGSARAKGVFRFMSGFTDFVPQGWLRAAQQREKTGLATTAAPTEPEGEVI